MSRIEQLIDEIEEYVEGCKPAPFSQSKIIVHVIRRLLHRRIRLSAMLRLRQNR